MTVASAQCRQSLVVYLMFVAHVIAERVPNVPECTVEVLKRIDIGCCGLVRSTSPGTGKC